MKRISTIIAYLDTYYLRCISVPGRCRNSPHSFDAVLVELLFGTEGKAAISGIFVLTSPFSLPTSSSPLNDVDTISLSI